VALSVGPCIIDEAESLLMSIRDATAYEVVASAQAVHAKACALLTLLSRNSTREEIAFIHAAAVKLADDADWQDDAEEYWAGQ
jgi:hypothetical protein